MSDHDPTTPKPLVLRVEISAEQAASLAPIFGVPVETASEEVTEPRPYFPPTPSVHTDELKQMESDLEQREAEFEADVQIREDKMERWRTELEELERSLDRRERDLISYVDQLQGAMSGSGDAWWSRPAGGDGGV
jgi:predicted RNase H-like nuclease (RuvC/YqgF family)